MNESATFICSSLRLCKLKERNVLRRRHGTPVQSRFGLELTPIFLNVHHDHYRDDYLSCSNPKLNFQNEYLTDLDDNIIALEESDSNSDSGSGLELGSDEFEETTSEGGKVEVRAQDDMEGILTKGWDLTIEEQEAQFKGDLREASGVRTKRTKAAPRPILSHQVKYLSGDGIQAYVDNNLHEAIMHEVMRALCIRRMGCCLIHSRTKRKTNSGPIGTPVPSTTKDATTSLFAEDKSLNVSQAKLGGVPKPRLMTAQLTVFILAERPDVVVEQVRPLITTHQLNNEPLRILLASLASVLKLTHSFITSTLQKHLFREMKLSDTAVKNLWILRWNGLNMRYAATATTSGAVGRRRNEDGE
ncbi:hypothetical protein BJ165DRAFT_1530829 [Panaeolus papilionaceus]|nr:hypothetical protein BJ165DRAFT_1530829 [Panaeolus papilionaceus]